MEKFYIVSNEKFLKEIDDFVENERKRNEFVKDFFERHGIFGGGYYMGGTGLVNVPFQERGKDEIYLYCDDNEENIKAFGKWLSKPRYFGEHALRKFRKGCALLKEFQNECIEKEIVINSHFHREGDYFNELHMGGYSTTRFSFNGKYYLRVETDVFKSITPSHDGFEEIKGSEFHKALEEYNKEDTNNANHTD